MFSTQSLLLTIWRKLNIYWVFIAAFLTKIMRLYHVHKKCSSLDWSSRKSPSSQPMWPAEHRSRCIHKCALLIPPFLRRIYCAYKHLILSLYMSFENRGENMFIIIKSAVNLAWSSLYLRYLFLRFFGKQPWAGWRVVWSTQWRKPLTICAIINNPLIMSNDTDRQLIADYSSQWVSKYILGLLSML